MEIDKKDGRIANFFWADGQFIMDYACSGDLYGVVGDPTDEAHVTVQWRGVTLELPVAMSNDYVSIVRHCCELSSDERK
jgi:hypothetical protein